VVDISSELLDTCRIAEDIWEREPERTTSLRAEIDRLWHAYEQVRSGSENVEDEVIDIVALCAQLQVSTDDAPMDGVPTNVLLAAWRDAERALSRTKPGTLPRLLACRALKAARDAYHAHVNAIGVHPSID
jgi:predicted nuclease with RNAse H fold